MIIGDKIHYLEKAKIRVNRATRVKNTQQRDNIGSLSKFYLNIDPSSIFLLLFSFTQLSQKRVKIVSEKDFIEAIYILI